MFVIEIHHHFYDNEHTSIRILIFTQRRKVMIDIQNSQHALSSCMILNMTGHTNEFMRSFFQL